MQLLKHDLAHEFPEYLEKMHELKTNDAHFAKLFARYDESDHAIKKYELGHEAISSEALEGLKKERLNIKDQVYKMLSDD